jgi:hypothetical protein
MKYKTHNDRKININESCLQGYIKCDYNKLVSLFGEPCEGDAYKIDAEWIIKFDDGSIATIYNWKNGKNYCGDGGEDVQNITDWHVGGFSKQSVWTLMELLEENPDEVIKTRLQNEIEALRKQKQCIMHSINGERDRVILELQSAIKIIKELC